MIETLDFLKVKDEIVKVKAVLSLSSLRLVQLQNFNGEAVSFWQAIYLDCGTLKIHKDSEIYVLKEGCMCFIEPQHEYRAEVIGVKACEVTIVSYLPEGKVNNIFIGKILSLSLDSKDILSALGREFQKTYYLCVENAHVMVVPNRNMPFAAQQLLCKLFEQFSIQLIRDLMTDKSPLFAQGSVKQSKDRLLVKEIIMYLHSNIYKRITIAEISNDLFLSKTYMQTLFKKQMETSIMDYFKRLKIDAAKIMMEEGKMNFTEISEKLGFSSIYHFSRRFKEIVGVTPSEYSHSIRKHEE